MSSLAATSEEADLGDVVEYRSPESHRQWTAFVGMLFFLASWVMLFAALFFIYGGLRTRADVWPPVDVPHLPVGLPGLNTLVVLLSSATFVWATRGILQHRNEQLQRGLKLTLVLGCAFMALQTWLWVDLYQQGLTWQTGSYGAIFFSMTWLHAAHVIVGLGALGWLSFHASRGAYTAARHISVRLWGIYWHFVGIIWGLLFLTLYVL